MAMNAETIALVAATYLLAGIVKGVTGLGVPVVGVAFVAPVLGLKTAVAVVLVPSLVTNFWQAIVGTSFLRILSRIWPLLITASVGIWFGSGILASADGRILILFLGCFLIAYTSIALFRTKLPSPGHHEVWLTPTIGAAGGVVFGMIGSFMVPGTLYIQSLGMSRDMFVQALGITFVTVTLILTAAMTQRAMLSHELGLLSAIAVPPTLVGMAVGQRLRQILTEEQFTRIVLVVIMISGFYMIARSLLSA